MEKVSDVYALYMPWTSVCRSFDRVVRFKERLVRFYIGYKCMLLWVISQNGSQSCRRAGSFGPRKVGIWCCVLVTDSRMDVHFSRVYLWVGSRNGKFRHWRLKFFVLSDRTRAHPNNAATKLTMRLEPCEICCPSLRAPDNAFLSYKSCPSVVFLSGNVISYKNVSFWQILYIFLFVCVCVLIKMSIHQLKFLSDDDESLLTSILT